MRDNQKVRIYTTPKCPFCKKTKEFFKKNGVKYEEENVLEDEKARDEMVKKSGQMSVPVTEIITSGEISIIVGFEEEKLKKVLGIK